MKVMVIVKATKESEAGMMPDEKVIAAMGRFKEELVGGYWLWQVKSMDEAVEWARRCADYMPAGEWVLEIRPIFEAEDFGKEFTPDLRAQEQRLRAEIERQRKS